VGLDMALAFFFCFLFCPFLFCFVLMQVESVELGHDPDCAVFFFLVFFMEVKGFGIRT